MPASMGDQSADRVMPSMLPSPPMSAAWGMSGGNIWAAATSDALHPMGPAEPDSRSWYYAPGPVDDSQSASVLAPEQPSQRGFYPPPQQTAHRQGTVNLPFIEKAKPAQPAPVRVLIQRLSPTTSAAELRLMLVFSQELLGVELISPNHSKGETHGSAVLYFRTLDGASEARNKLDGRPNPSGSDTMKVSIVSHSAYASPAYGSPAYDSPTRASSTAPNGAPNGFTDFAYYNNSPQPPLSNGLVSPTAQPGRFFPGPGPVSGHASAAAAPLSGAPIHHQDFAAPNTQAGSHYKEMFNRQPPIGNYLPNEVPGRLGKHLINDEPGDEDDRELLRDSIAYANRGTPVQRRDAPVTPPDSVNQAMAALSLDPSISLKTAPMPAYVAGMPAVIGVNDIYVRLEQHFRRQQQQFHLQQHHQSDRPDKRSSRHASRQQQALYGGSNYPPVNPADQNPPCNTLYVGNLPMDACEEELKILFSLTRGYKRLCFRTKHNGPMCFVEYEDIAHATKTLTALYGFPLHNSVKGGIRLSFSKNPLGVRSASSQPPHGNLYLGGGMRTHAANGFAAASGPPPGLPGPPGLSSRPPSNFGAGSRSGSAMGAPVNGSVNGSRNGSVHGHRNGNVHGQRNGGVSGAGSEAGSNFAQRAPYYRNGTNGTNGMNGVYNMNSMNGMNGMNGMPNMNGMNGMNGLNGLNGMNGMNGIKGLTMAKPRTPVV